MGWKDWLSGKEGWIPDNITGGIPTKAAAKMVIDPLVGELQRDKAVVNGPDYGALWGDLYQTGNDAGKIRAFRAHNQAKEYIPMRQAINDIMPAFSGDIQGFLGEDDFKELLYQTGRHESYNAKDPNNPYTAQMDGGPARSWWQVEPATARDIVTARHNDGTSNASMQYWGPGAQKVTRYSADQLYNMSDADLNQLLQSDPRVGAAFAAAKYIKAHRAKK